MIKLISKDSIEDCILQLGQKKLKLEQDMTAADQGKGLCAHRLCNCSLVLQYFNATVKENALNLKMHFRISKTVICDRTRGFDTTFYSFSCRYYNIFTNMVWKRYLIKEMYIFIRYSVNLWVAELLMHCSIDDEGSIPDDMASLLKASLGL